MIYADGPQRAVLTNAKHPNGKTLYPCPYCRVQQTGERGCPLGRHDFDITSTSRCRQEYEEAFARLKELPLGSTVRENLSRDLGVVPRREGLPHPMYDLVRGGEILRRIPPEALHADALVRVTTHPVRTIHVYWATTPPHAQPGTNQQHFAHTRPSRPVLAVPPGRR